MDTLKILEDEWALVIIKGFSQLSSFLISDLILNGNKNEQVYLPTFRVQSLNPNAIILITPCVSFLICVCACLYVYM